MHGNGYARFLSRDFTEIDRMAVAAQRADMKTESKETSRGGLAVNVIEC